VTRRLARRALGLGAALVALGGALLTACAPPDRGAAGAPALLYVANGLDGTVTRLDARSGRALGPALPAGPAPAQVAAGLGGALVVLAAGPLEPGGPTPLTHVAPTAGGWAARAVALEPRATGVLLAGEGGPQAVVAYHAPGPDAGGGGPVCRLAVVDARTGDLTRTHTLPPAVCGPHDSVRSLALARGAGAPTVYLGIWRWPEEGADATPAGRGRIVALRADTGAVAGVTPLAGAPERLVVAGGAGGTDGADPRLVCLEAEPGPPPAAGAPEPVPQERRQLLLLDPVAGQVEAVFPVTAPPRAVAVAPDGRHAYLLATLDGPRSVLEEVDLSTGAARRLATVPGLSLGIAVVGDRIYVPRSDGAALLVLDRQRGRAVGTIPVGRRPLGLTLGSSGE
jgi:hypothetical protein